MNSYLVNLCHLINEVSAEAKLLMASMIRQHGGQIMSGLDNGVVRSLGLSARVAARLGAELVEAGHMIREPSSAVKKRGRPASEYRVSPRLLGAGKLLEAGTQLQQDKDQGGYFEGIMEFIWSDLAEWSGERRQVGMPPSRLGAAQRLSASNRLLLMLLLGVANSDGVVRNWRPAELAKLAGLTNLQLHNQVQKLTDLGYIRGGVPGVTGRSLFGKRAGAYFLNLSHPSFGKAAISGQLLLYPVAVALELFNRHRGDAKSLYCVAQKSKGCVAPSSFCGVLLQQAGMTDSDGRLVLAQYFDGKGSPNLPDYFQMKVEEYASWLLTHKSNGLAFAIGNEDWLTQRLNDELFLSKKLDEKSDLGATEAKRRARIVGLVSYLAIQLAKKIWVALLKTYLKPFDEIYGSPCTGGALWRYSILPAITSASGEYLVVHAMSQSLSPNPQGESEVYCLEFVDKGYKPFGTDKKTEMAYTDKDKYHLGLRTRPKSVQKKASSL